MKRPAKRSRLALALVFMTLSLLACSGDLRDAAGAPPEGWTAFTSNGLTINHPDGWQASVDPANGTVILIGPEGRSLAVRPFFTPQALSPDSAGAALTSLATAILPGAVWDAPELRVEGAARMTGTAGTGQGLAVLTWVQSEQGSAGMVGVATGADIEASADDFSRMLASFRIQGAPVDGSGGSSLDYEVWTDPTEGAFTVEVPTGWTAEGATIRLCPAFPEIGIEVTSPDGALYAKVGNDYHWYTLPIPSLGLGPGTTYSLPACTYQSPVANYSPGASFLTDVLLPEVHPDAQVTEVRNRPDLASQLSAVGFYPYDAGEVDYTYSGDGSQRNGTALAITQKIVGGSDIFSGAEAGSWSIWELVAAEGPPDRHGEAAAVALHMAESLRFDPTWLQTQLEITAAQSQIIADMSNDIAETMSEGYWGQQATYDDIFDRQSDATLEVEDFVDPVTGDTYELNSSPSYYWIDPAGNIVGTETSTLPGIDFRPLFEIEG